MENFKSKEEIFESQNFNPDLVQVSGVPEQHVEAVKAFVSLCVAHDALNKSFNPDWTDYDQYKYSAFHKMGSSSGAGFSFGGYGGWSAASDVGSRLCSESEEIAEKIAEVFHDEYQKFKVYDRKID